MTGIENKEKGFHLKRLDTNSIKENKSEIRLFLVERNEISKLPYFLEYYRRIGVNRFFVVDDKSSDGSREYLLKQDDCHIFEPSNTFKESRAGVDWQNFLLDTYGTGHWTIVADADELLIYPHIENVTLPDLCRYLDKEGSMALFGFLLDMYPQKDLTTATYESGKPFFETCPYFDSEYFFRKIGTFSSPIHELPRVRVVGGPRVRLFYPLQNKTSILSRLLNTAIIKICDRLKFIKGDKPHYAPALIKMPLVKWGAEVERLSNHVISVPAGSKISSLTGAIMHFKFFADFHEKAISEVNRGVHFGGSLEYKRYLKHTKKNSHMVLYYEGSRKFEGSGSLLKEGLIRSNESFDLYATKLETTQ